MFKNFIQFALKNMSSQTKGQQTLSSKLKAKKTAPTMPQKLESELKPQLFSELKNMQKAKVTQTKKNNIKTEDATSQRKSTKKAGLKVASPQQDDDMGVVEAKKTRCTSKSINLENDREEEFLDNETATISLKAVENKALANANNATTCEIPIKIEDDYEESKLQEWEPNNWNQVLENIRTMRSSDTAPVDTMGCHKCADESADEKTQRFHKLVALMLSSQTKDEITYHAMLRLREQTLTPESICEMKVNVLENILHPVSFYKNKAKYLQKTAKILIDNYNSDIPNTIKELVALPGVGPKMAHICMSTAWHQTTGIGVDVHVHRISNRLQWLPKPTKEPEQTRVALESWLPRDLWKEVNHLLVGFGQTICTPLKPKCVDCLNCPICPSAPKSMKSKEKLQNKEIKKLCDKSKFKKAKMHL